MINHRYQKKNLPIPAGGAFLPVHCSEQPVGGKARAALCRRWGNLPRKGTNILQTKKKAALDPKPEKGTISGKNVKWKSGKPAKNEKNEKNEKLEKNGKAVKAEKAEKASGKQKQAPKAAHKNAKQAPKNAQKNTQKKQSLGEELVTPRRAKPERAAGGKKPTVRIIPLGGLNEIGKNMTVFECEDDAVIVDCGLCFPDSDMLGVDLVIPDFSYLEKIASKVRGVFITHGHEDHIGAIPYLLRRFSFPIYGTRLSLGLIEGKLREHGLLGDATLIPTNPGQTVKAGKMAVEFIHVNHSIPDAVAFAIHTAAGILVHTGDFKIDYSPIEGGPIDLARFAELGREGVLCLLADSTNAEKSGSTNSESTVGQTFETLFTNAVGHRIIVATFASNIHRIQQIVDKAVEFGRHVAVSGRSMVNAVETAQELGYLSVPEGVLIDVDNISRFPADRVVLITTGSQGEPLSALSRMASGEHRKVSVTSQDVIIISATPIPGNEKHVTRVINDLLHLGAEVIYSNMYEVHVSGHACQEEQKLILSLTKPRYFLPVHGEFKHLYAHARTALKLGMAPENIHIGAIGQVLELSDKEMKCVETVEAGGVFVDGLGVGDVGSIVLRDRKHLSEDGLIVVVATLNKSTGACMAGPDIVSRGFVYVRESEALMEEAKMVVEMAMDRALSQKNHDWSSIKQAIKDSLSNYIYRKTKRSPMILPIIMEI